MAFRCMVTRFLVSIFLLAVPSNAMLGEDDDDGEVFHEGRAGCQGTTDCSDVLFLQVQLEVGIENETRIHHASNATSLLSEKYASSATLPLASNATSLLTNASAVTIGFLPSLNNGTSSLRLNDNSSARTPPADFQAPAINGTSSSNLSSISFAETGERQQSGLDIVLARIKQNTDRIPGDVAASLLTILAVLVILTGVWVSLLPEENAHEKESAFGQFVRSRFHDVPPKPSVTPSFLQQTLQVNYPRIMSPISPGVAADLLLKSKDVASSSSMPVLPRIASTLPRILPRSAASTPRAGSGTIIPEICPSLVLPHVEAQFMIEADVLRKKGSGDIEIKNTSGKAILVAMVDEVAGCLMLRSPGHGNQTPRTAVFAPKQAGLPYALYGKNQSSYGTLEKLPQGSIMLKCNAQPKLSVQLRNNDNLEMVAYAADGSELASAQVGRPNARGEIVQTKEDDVWTLTIHPGVDAVLITTCMLTMLLLK